MLGGNIFEIWSHKAEILLFSLENGLCDAVLGGSLRYLRERGPPCPHYVLSPKVDPDFEKILWENPSVQVGSRGVFGTYFTIF